MILTHTLKSTEIMQEICRLTDYPLEEYSLTTTTEIPEFKLPQEPFGIGLIVGSSGSGKSTLLKSLGKLEDPQWDESLSVADHFVSADEAKELLGASGLNSVPTWLRPHHLLSNGEQYRANLSRQIKDGALIDEFTSVVDRNVAKSCSVSLSKYVKRAGIKSVVIASCHYDIIDWLQPDWIFDCNTGTFTDRGSVRRPDINVQVLPCHSEAWSFFSKHHYLTANINKSARCWLAVWGGVVVGFASAIAYPSGTVKNAWRGHRTVIFPEFQGMGIGSKLSDAVAEIFVSQGCRYFSKTAHPTLGLYRESSPKWKPTSKNRKARPDYNSNRKTKEDKYKHLHVDRVCFSHEYIGNI